MNSIQVLDKEFVPYLVEKEIQEKITALAVRDIKIIANQAIYIHLLRLTLLAPKTSQLQYPVPMRQCMLEEVNG